MQGSPVTFDSMIALLVAVGLAIGGIAVAAFKRSALPPLSRALGAAGMLLLAVAAGGPQWRGRGGGEIVVMVDVSPSTRTAHYRDAELLRARVRQLIGGAPYRMEYFPAGGAAGIARLADVAVGQTRFDPPAAAAVLLFSDARFDLPASAPPTHVVVDPGLENVPDAAVERLEVLDGRVVITARNDGPGRRMTVSGSSRSGDVIVPTGGSTVATPVQPGSTVLITARLAPGDPWPENDTLSLALPPPPEAQRWWVGRASGGDGWESMAPRELPDDSLAYLGPAVIVLDNVSAGELTEVQQRRLVEYVRDLGGGLVILGGDRAYAAGGYAGSRLDTISPLASHPPQPSAHWIFLIDSSGSMNAAAAGGASRWRVAVDAVATAVPGLPTGDLLSVGGFAGDVQWWLRRRAAGDAAAIHFPPRDAGPSGPTELRRALERALSGAAEGAPAVEEDRVEVVILTDANAPLEAPEALADAMRRAGARLHLLDIGGSQGPGLLALRQVVEATGGKVLQESEPSAWSDAVRRIARSAAPDQLVRATGTVTFTGPLDDLSEQSVSPPWNRTWLKPRAESVAEGVVGAERIAAGAAWEVGEGRVLAFAFGAAPQDAGPWLALVERAPRDPRIRVTWGTGSKLSVSVEAVDRSETGGGRLMNGLDFTLELTALGGEQGPGVGIPQLGPGAYRVTVAAPSAPAFASVRLGSRVADRIAVAGRYGPEFEHLGNDRPAMRELAARTGGSVVEPSDARGLDLPRSERNFPLTSWAAAAGAALIAAALVRWCGGSS